MNPRRTRIRRIATGLGILLVTVATFLTLATIAVAAWLSSVDFQIGRIDIGIG